MIEFGDDSQVERQLSCGELGFVALVGVSLVLAGSIHSCESPAAPDSLETPTPSTTDFYLFPPTPDLKLQQAAGHE